MTCVCVHVRVCVRVCVCLTLYEIFLLNHIPTAFKGSFVLRSSINSSITIGFRTNSFCTVEVPKRFICQAPSPPLCLQTHSSSSHLHNYFRRFCSRFSEAPLCSNKRTPAVSIRFCPCLLSSVEGHPYPRPETCSQFETQVPVHHGSQTYWVDMRPGAEELLRKTYDLPSCKLGYGRGIKWGQISQVSLYSQLPRRWASVQRPVNVRGYFS